MTKKEKISLGIAVGAAAAVWFLERRLNTSGTAGIGNIPSWNKRNIENYFFNYINRIPDEVQVWLTDRNEKGYAYVQFIVNDIATRGFYLSEENIAYLSELCDEYNVEFNAWDGKYWIPSMRVVAPLSFFANKQ